MSDPFVIRVRCSVCQGSGKLLDKDGIEYVCPSCSGEKSISTQMTVDLEEILDKLKKIKKTVDDIWDKVK